MGPVGVSATTQSALGKRPNHPPIAALAFAIAVSEAAMIDGPSEKCSADRPEAG